MRFAATNATTKVYLSAQAGPMSGVFGSVSFRELPGNHRFQTAAASRPMLRYNATTGSHFISYDGSDDFLVTNPIDFTATDKVSVFAGVRKLSDAAVGMLAELSVSSANNGSFYIVCSSVLNYHQARIAGSLQSTVNSSAVPAPRSSVVSLTGDIGADKTDFRVDGVSFRSAADLGTGMFGNHTMYFGRRAGTSLPFNGHEYSPICVGRLTTADETANIERLLARQTGVTLA